MWEKLFFRLTLQSVGGAKYWKPIQCGEPSDEDRVGELIGFENIHSSTYKLKESLSPHRAAELENRELDMTRCVCPSGPLVVEGAGGVYVPIKWDFHMMDLMAQLSLPVILVARSSLGTLNHSFLSIEALRSRGLDLKCVVMVGLNESNRSTVERIAQIPVFEFPWLNDLGGSGLEMGSLEAGHLEINPVQTSGFKEFHSLDFQKGFDFFLEQ